MKRLVVVGGGIAGLAAAWSASQAAAARPAIPGARPREDLEITLVDRERRLGGKIQTDRVDGFLLEAGPDSFLSRKPAAARLCEALGISSRLQPRRAQPRRTFVRHDHRLHPLPEGFTGLVPTDLAALQGCELLSAEARQRALREPEIPPRVGSDDESVESFMTRRFGAETFQLLIEPLVSGIYAGDAARLSLLATYPHLREIELRHGNLSRGLARSAAGAPAALPAAGRSAKSRSVEGRSAEGRPPAGPAALDSFLSFPSGMAELVTGLEEQLSGVRILRGVEARAVSETRSGFCLDLEDRTSLDADALILATPACDAAPLLEAMDPSLGRMLADIPFASPAIVHLAFRRSDVKHPLDGYGYVIPSVEGNLFIACTWTSSKWEGRAPDGMVLLRLYAGRAGRSDPGQDAELERLALAEVSSTLGTSAPPVLSRVSRWQRGMPQYTLEHSRRRAAIEERLRDHRGLLLAGASYRGVGIPDCIESGQEAARTALSLLYG